MNIADHRQPMMVVVVVLMIVQLLCGSGGSCGSFVAAQSVRVCVLFLNG